MLGTQSTIKLHLIIKANVEMDIWLIMNNVRMEIWMTTMGVAGIAN